MYNKERWMYKYTLKICQEVSIKQRIVNKSYKNSAQSISLWEEYAKMFLVHQDIIKNSYQNNTTPSYSFKPCKIFIDNIFTVLF